MKNRERIATCYDDALTDIFENYKICTSQYDVFIQSDFGKSAINTFDENFLSLSARFEYGYNIFYFFLIENQIIVNEKKINLHEMGYNVETVNRVYGKSIFGENKNTLLDLEYTSYIVSNFYRLPKLIDIDSLKEKSLSIDSFSAHMRYIYSDSSTSCKYPSHVFLNGKDISILYKDIDGIDKIYKIYKLFSISISEEISNKRKQLIGEKMDIDIQNESIEKMIERNAYSKRRKPLIIDINGTRYILRGTTPNQSIMELDKKIDAIIKSKKFG